MTAAMHEEGWKDFLIPGVPKIATSLAIFLAASTFLSAQTCLEGDTTLGFPFAFFVSCSFYVGTFFYPFPFVADVVVWYFASAVVVSLYRRTRKGRPSES